MGLDKSLEGNWGTLGWRPPLSTKVSAGWPCGIGPEAIGYPRSGGSPRSLEAYFRALENLDREKAGLPALPYTEEDRQDDEEFLLETLPSYRASLGWQTEEARHVLDIWEQDTIERLQKGMPQ
jgi:hypothetical protein